MVKRTSYLDEGMLPYPFCPGCGHSLILNRLNEALIQLQVDPEDIVIVSDIGCVGLSDKYFITNTFHGLHGRSVTYATGIKLANPELKVIVVMGDGGCGIGGHHLINAARRNIGVTVLVFNNFNYGMTGGEHSATTPTGANTPTTRYGNLERPMDICGTVAINGATFVARTTAFDKNLTAMMTEAIQHDGFSLIDIWELCTAYYVPHNRFSKRLLEETLSTSGFSSGIIQKVTRPEFSQAYHDQMRDQLGLLPLTEKPIKPKYSNKVGKKMNWIVAGAAGKKIGFATSAFCRGAVLSGLWATQRNDYKITVKSGYSLSEVIISPQDIQCTTITKADFLVVLFPEGLKKVFPHIHKLTENDILYINNSLLPIETRAKIVGMDFRKTGKKKEFWAVMALAEILRNTNIYPLEAFIEAVSQRDEFSEKNLEAIETGKGLLIK